MKKKGFTLIELLAVIAVLAAILLVGVPPLINTLQKNKEVEYGEFENSIKRAAEIYIERNRNLYPDLNDVGGSVEIDTNTLIKANYLDQSIKNPEDNTAVTNYNVIVEVGNDEVFIYTVRRK